MKVLLFWIFGALGVLGAIGGFLVAASGVMPLGASSGHWAITNWILHFSMQRSVATHSLTIAEPPGFEHSDAVLKGARHYELACRPCHGSQALPHARVPERMTPAPPYLPKSVAQWKPRELFYIVRHGIKFTGMPAWPADGRDDEVWAMVAFLRKLPSLNAAEYRRMAVGNEADACARCHAAEGAFPRLEGQPEEYLRDTLRAYARRRRHSGIMEPIATGLTDQEIDRWAAHYASRPAARVSRQGGPGEKIALEGIPRQHVPACTACHGRHASFPVLDGQPVEYLVLQLEHFKLGARGGTGRAPLMQTIAERLTPEQMRATARYFSK